MQDRGVSRALIHGKLLQHLVHAVHVVPSGPEMMLVDVTDVENPVYIGDTDYETLDPEAVVFVILKSPAPRKSYTWLVHP